VVLYYVRHTHIWQKVLCRCTFYHICWETCRVHFSDQHCIFY